MTRRWSLIIGGVALIGVTLVIVLFSLLSTNGDSAPSIDQTAPLQPDEYWLTVTAIVQTAGREVASIITNTPVPTPTQAGASETPTNTAQPSPTTPPPTLADSTSTNDDSETPGLVSGTDIGLSSNATNEANMQGDEPTPTPQINATFLPQAVPTPIGEGTFLVYAPENAEAGNTILVELELEMETIFETAATATPQATEQEANTRATFTPVLIDGNLGRSPVRGVGENRVPIYPLMGASLTCPPQTFNGCEDGVFIREIDPTRGQENWLWLISAQDDISGSQPMFIEVFRITGYENGEPILRPHAGPYRFQITFVTASTTNLTPFIIAVGTLFVLALLAGVLLWRSRQTEPPSPKKSLTVDGRKPYIFISYRRGSSWSLARSIANSLEERGAEVFLDVDDINEGRFADILENAIKRCDYFVPILAPGTLDSVWCRKEIAFALEQKKTVIPLLSEGYSFDAGTVPAEIKDISSHNAITVLPEFYEAAVERLARRFIKLEE
ncbi:MAG: toll/interleukin-1 receptor domain-containing protein [Aggregatilineales bacterium]